MEQSLSLEQRKDILARAVTQEVALGARLEHQMDGIAVVVSGQKVNHILHFLISIFTCGLWALVWIGLAASGGEVRKTLSVDAAGRVLVNGQVPQAAIPQLPSTRGPGTGALNDVVAWAQRNQVMFAVLAALAIIAGLAVVRILGLR